VGKEEGEKGELLHGLRGIDAPAIISAGRADENSIISVSRTDTNSVISAPALIKILTLIETLTPSLTS